MKTKITLLFYFCISTLSIQENLFSQTGWIQQNSGVGSDLYVISFLNKNMGFAAGVGCIFLKTTNEGNNWTWKYIDTNIYALYGIKFFDSANGIMSGCAGRIYKTTDGGMNWSISQLGTNNGLRPLFFIDNQTGWALSPTILYKTTNAGINWSSTILPDSLNAYSIFFYDNNTGWMCGSYEWGYPTTRYLNKIYKSINGGLNWNLVYYNINLPNSCLWSISFGNLSNGICGGAFQDFTTLYTTDGGLNWQSSKLDTFNCYFVSLKHVSSYTAYCAGSEVAKTTNGGISWIEQNLINECVMQDVFFMDSMYGWACGLCGRIYHTTSGGDPIGVLNMSNIIPHEYSLYQNYPNPFNPTTTVSFDLPRNTFTKIIIYDITGREVQTLVNEDLKA
jgi:photosystem II stability/assembly factor-like uncharacterized protein